MSARELAARLGLRRARATEWRGDCPACGYAGSLILSLGSEGKALWWCASCRDKEALTAALRGDGYAIAPAPRDRVPGPSSGQREAWARALWARGVPIAGTAAEAYLRSRGLGTVASDALRFLPAERHTDSGHVGPVMLAAACDVAGTIRAVHRTWLCEDGTGKANVDPPRKTLGPPAGCAVRLMPAGDAVAVAEGLETALSAAVLFDIPAWSCLTAGGLEAVQLPASIRTVLIAADNDMSGTGQRAADALAQRLLAEGRAVRVAIPDRPGEDFNDVLRRRTAHHG
ncbi:MAG: toprim domain-containing protein [Acetobacteraceae bacterium]|jgi:putative DNA primase/helicase|nr:toprim domain-containing protein [Acetobacteraceae bacterium]